MSMVPAMILRNVDCRGRKNKLLLKSFAFELARRKTDITLSLSYRPKQTSDEERGW